MSSRAAIPVTVLTGYLGSGKTTLLNRILSERPDERIVVVENEAGEIAIDQDLVVRSAEEVIPTGGGCACCAVREDLIEALDAVLDGEHAPDRIIIETSGLADPAPIAQTFLDTDRFRNRLRLDGIVTLVDAKHVGLHLDDSAEARKQIALADRLVLNKVDLVEERDLEALEKRLDRLNSGAVRLRANRAKVSVDELLEIGGFDSTRAFNLDDGAIETERLFGWAGAYDLQSGVVDVTVADCPAMAVTIVCLPAPSATEAALSGLGALADALFAEGHTLVQPGESFIPAALGRQLMVVEPNVAFRLEIEEPGVYAVFLEQPPNPGGVELRARGGEILHPRAESHATLFHDHQDDVRTVSLELDSPLDGDAIAAWLTALLRVQGEDLFRTKGILNVSGMKERFVIQAVHMMLDGGPDRPWAPDEDTTSRLVFIGRDLDREALLTGFRSCAAVPVHVS